VFSFVRPNPTEINRAVSECSRLKLQPALLASRQGLKLPELPVGFSHDFSRTQVGKGQKIFEAAVAAFKKWKQFDLGWVRVANPGARVAFGELIAVEIHALRLWSLNISQIVEVVRDASAFGFIYSTTPHHAELGEERFLLTFDSRTEEVQYELEAVSRPGHWMAKLGYPATRAFQHRFARDSHRCVRESVSQSVG
jgi:uncharacterized protein (UPF0548 family)